MSDQHPPPPPGNYPPNGGGYPPQGGQPYGYPPQPPQKKSKTLRNIIIGAVVFLILMCGGCFALIGGAADEASKEIDKALESDSPKADEPKATEKETKEDEPEPEPEPEPEAKWKTVAKLEGNTNKAGSDFHLNGCDTRMKYNLSGSDSVIAAFYVMESGTKLMEDGGIPVASPTEAGKGETVIRQDEGDYYIEVVAANVNWTVQVQEKC